MTDPIILAIAAAIAGKGAESLGSQAGPALTRLIHRIKQRFAAHPEEAATLTAAQAPASVTGEATLDDARPDEAERTAALAAALTRTAASDPAFAKDLHTLWQQVQAPTDDAIINNLNAPAEKVVQLRDVHGDFHIS